MKRTENQTAKYKVLLVAYKDLDIKTEDELAEHFIEIIKNKEDILEDFNVNTRNSLSFSHRVNLYKSWFKEDILENLDNGYNLGIVEIPKSYGDSYEKVLQELDEKFGDKIIIIKTEKI